MNHMFYGGRNPPPGLPKLVLQLVSQILHQDLPYFIQEHELLFITEVLLLSATVHVVYLLSHALHLKLHYCSRQKMAFYCFVTKIPASEKSDKMSDQTHGM